MAGPEQQARTTNNYTRWLYALVVLLVVLAGLYLSGWAYGVLQACGNILALYFTAWLLQFFFTPVVDFLARRGLPRAIGVSAVYILLAVAFVGTLAWAIPAIYNEGTRLASVLRDPNNYRFIQNIANGIETFLVHNLHVPQKDIDAFTKGYSVRFQQGAIHAGDELQRFITGHLTATNITNSTNAFFGLLSTIQSFLLNSVIVLILAFYMTLDGRKLMRRALAYFPPAVDEVMEGVHGIINRKFGGFLRGQAILSASYGLLTYVIVTGFGLSPAIFIAIFAAIVMLIPFIGTFAAVIPPLLADVVHQVTSSAPFSLGQFLLLLAFLIGSQQVVFYFLAPRVMSSTIGMHPLLVVLGLLLGTKVAGLWGAIFGVPVFGVIVETIDLIYRHIMDRRFGFHPAAVEKARGDTIPPPPDKPDGKTPHAETPRYKAPRHAAARLKAGVTLRRPPGRHDTRS